MAIQTEPSVPDHPKLNVNKKDSTNEIKSTCAQTSSVCGHLLKHHKKSLKLFLKPSTTTTFIFLLMNKLKMRKFRSCLDVLVCIGVQCPLKNPTPNPFFTKSPLNLQTVQALLFRQFPSYILVFCEPAPKNQIFQ